MTPEKFLKVCNDYCIEPTWTGSVCCCMPPARKAVETGIRRALKKYYREFGLPSARAAKTEVITGIIDMTVEKDLLAKVTFTDGSVESFDMFHFDEKKSAKQIVDDYLADVLPSYMPDATVASVEIFRREFLEDGSVLIPVNG